MADDVISVLNNLIETSKDGEQGFRQAAAGVDDTSLKAVFETGANDCAVAARELEAEVQRDGGKPQTSGSVSGALHRGWMQVKSTVTSHDAHAVLAEVERGEDAAKKNYREALDRELPASVRMLIEKQYQGVTQMHDRIRDLRNQYASSARA